MADNQSLKVLPVVRSLARPQAAPLLSARAEIQRNPEIQRLFEASTREQWEAHRLADAVVAVLQDQLEAPPEQLRQAVNYLVDEYQQVGNAMLIVSSTSGRAVARVTDEDLWVPPPTTREDGSLAVALPRLKPQLEGFIVQWIFDEAREQRALFALAQKTPLGSADDRRFLAVTRSGRKTITEELRELLPTLLPGRCQGLSGDFLAHFEFQEAPPLGLTPLPRCVAVAQSRLGTQDLRTFNLHHDRLTAMTARVAVQWVREVARHLSLFFRNLDEPIACQELTETHLQGADFWVAPPDEALVLRRTFPGISVLPVNQAKVIGLRGSVGTIVMHTDAYTCDSRERFDRWDVLAQCSFTVWVNPEKIELLRLTEVPQSGLSVEVL